MELGQIEAFERVARDGNFTRAADSLGLTQPAVSTRIALLETELGGQLFERRGRELFLTPLGDYFMPFAVRILSVRSESLQAVRNFHSGRLGQIKIAAPTPFVLSFLVNTLAAFRDEHPSVDVLIRERNKTTIFDMLYEREITLGLVNAPVFDRKITQLARFQDPIRAVVAPGHILALKAGHHRTLKMESIYEHTIFRVSMFPQMTAFIDTVVDHGRTGSGGAVIAVPMVMALQLVLMGQGVTFLPESYVKLYVGDGQLIYLTIEEMPRLMSQPILIAHQDYPLDDLHGAFVSILIRQLGHLSIA
jgi:DNA-binding transcriptional LysR family regulator